MIGRIEIGTASWTDKSLIACSHLLGDLDTRSRDFR